MSDITKCNISLSASPKYAVRNKEISPDFAGAAVG